MELFSKKLKPLGRLTVASIFPFFILTSLLSVNASTDNSGGKTAPVMLANQWDKKEDVKGWWMSEKLDGVRGYWTGEALVSRSGNPFHVPKWFTRNFPSTPLDGELWLGRQQFSELVSIVRTETTDTGWKKVRYMIFDVPQAEGGFEDRIDFARRWFGQHPNPHIEVVQQEVCESEEFFQKRLAEIESIGGEGVMLRRPNSPYTIGRSSDLLKVKSFADAEAIVIGHLPGLGRNAKRLGALLVKLPDGVQFKIGTGFSDRERDKPPPIGSTITFKFYGLNKSGVPRFASFLRIREEI